MEVGSSVEKLVALKVGSWRHRVEVALVERPAAGANVNILRHNWRVDLLHIKQRPQAA